MGEEWGKDSRGRQARNFPPRMRLTGGGHVGACAKISMMGPPLTPLRSTISIEATTLIPVYRATSRHAEPDATLLVYTIEYISIDKGLTWRHGVW